MLLLMLWVGLLCSHAHISSSWKVPLFIILLCFFFFFWRHLSFCSAMILIGLSHDRSFSLCVCVQPNPPPAEIIPLITLFHFSYWVFFYFCFRFTFVVFSLFLVDFHILLICCCWKKMNFGRLRRSNQHPTAFYSYLHLFCFSSLFVIPAARLIPFFPPFLPLFFFFFSLLLPQTSYFIFLVNFRPFMQLIITLEKARECFVLSIALHQKICNSYTLFIFSFLPFFFFFK